MGLERKVCFLLIFKNVSTTFCVQGKQTDKFVLENETESRSPFSENLKLKVGRFRKAAIVS